MSDIPARSRRRLSGAGNAAAVAAAPAGVESDGVERQRERKKPGRKPATSVLCQVAGCGAELLRPGATAGRDYYSRYRICREHCIAPQLIIDGKPQRFCQQAAGTVAAHQPTAFSGLGPEAAVAEVPGPLFPQPQISTSSSEELAERWLAEVLFDGAPADVKSPYEALLVSDVW
ncbi:hypothetical protein COHA_006313 [Chlorella ohadii]|uniref:SBP-type domain-containing protein n=1 Tax=Chlorella ohadii TaxID=2649997 RepID=A0AAD5DP78_9CHLO|nr:hypothetical protein COHA_006313 [Chlorella ohadii]